MGIDPGRSGLQPEPGSAMAASPAFGRIQQRLPDPARAAVRRHGQVLDPGSLPEPYGDNVEIDGCEPNECLGLVRHQNGRPIVRNGFLKPASGDIRRPVSWASAGSGKKPLVGRGEG
jgi:hypothetical protein